MDRQQLSSFFGWAGQYWHIVLTTLTVLVGTLVYVLSDDIADAAQHGDFFAGLCAALAFIWLLASFQQQRVELSLQRQELSLQRQALADQVVEMRKVSYLETASRAAHEMDLLERSLSNSRLGPKAIAEIGPSLVQGIGLWKSITESADPNSVLDAYMEWMPIEGAAISFLGRFVRAAQLVQDSSTADTSASTDDDIRYILSNQDAIVKLPLIGGYMGSATNVANFLLSTAPGRDTLTIAGMSALILTTNFNVVDKQQFDELVRAHQREFPMIYREHMQYKERA